MKALRMMSERVVNKSLLNPASWMGWACVFVAAWGVMHLLGWRAATSVISGTVDADGTPRQWEMMRGTMYALAYFASTVVAPILFLTSVIYLGGVTLLRRRTKSKTV